MKKKVLILSLLVATCQALIYGKSIYVSPNGNDSNDGSINYPYQTLIKACSEAYNNDEIIMLDGIYRIEKTILIENKKNITIRAYNQGKTIITSAINISIKNFRPIADSTISKRLNNKYKNNILELDIESFGTKVNEFNNLFNCRENFPELFKDENRLPLSRYPNTGYMKMAKVLDNFGNEEHGGVFQYNDERHSKWKDAVKEGLWMSGFWRVPWQSNTIRIKEIDVKNKTVTHTIGIGVSKNSNINGANNGIGSKYNRPNGSGEEPYYVINLPEELDLPGEWCVDFKRQKIYMCIPNNFARNGMEVSFLYNPIIVARNNDNLNIEGIIFQKSAQDGIHIVGGKNNRIIGCTFKNLNGTGVIIDDGIRHKIMSCDFFSLGKDGIIAMGGDRKTLTPCDFLIENNYFHNYGIIKDSWAPAIRLGRYDPNGGDTAGEDAVGINVRHNLVHDAPHSAFLYVGNLNIFEYNEVFDIAKKTGDVGAFYSRHDWTSRGNIIRNNFIHNIPRANGTYHDDGHSGDSVYNNIIHGASVGTLIGGGHNNVVINNIYIDCYNRGISIDSRGKYRNYTKNNKNYTYRFKMYDLCNGNWNKLYPDMCNWLNSNDKLELPHNDVVKNNVFINCGTGLFLSGSIDDFIYSPQLFNENNHTVKKDMINKLTYNRNINVLKSYVTDISEFKLKKIGLYIDKYRVQLPYINSILETISKNKGFDSTKDINATNNM